MEAEVEVTHGWRESCWPLGELSYWPSGVGARISLDKGACVSLGKHGSIGADFQTRIWGSGASAAAALPQLPRLLPCRESDGVGGRDPEPNPVLRC